MMYTIIDATGEPVSVISVPDDAHTALNTPSGCTAIEGEPSSFSCYYLDGAWVEKPVCPDPAYTWDKTNKVWFDPRSLAQAQDNQWTVVKAARDTALYSPLTWNGNVYDADAQSQSQIQGAVQLAVLAAQAGQTFSIQWTLADNTTVMLSGSDMVSLGLALGTAYQANFVKGVDLRNQINAATTIADVQAITWTQ